MISTAFEVTLPGIETDNPLFMSVPDALTVNCAVPVADGVNVHVNGCTVPPAMFTDPGFGPPRIPSPPPMFPSRLGATANAVAVPLLVTLRTMLTGLPKPAVAGSALRTPLKAAGVCIKISCEAA